MEEGKDPEAEEPKSTASSSSSPPTDDDDGSRSHGEEPMDLDSSISPELTPPRPGLLGPVIVSQIPIVSRQPRVGIRAYAQPGGRRTEEFISGQQVYDRDEEYIPEDNSDFDDEFLEMMDIHTVYYSPPPQHLNPLPPRRRILCIPPPAVPPPSAASTADIPPEFLGLMRLLYVSNL